MPDAQRIDPALVEKVEDAMWDVYDAGKGSADDKPLAEAAIRAVFNELGLKEEHRAARQAMVGPPEAPWQEVPPCVRLVSDWRPA